jgi:hypothetical protein
MLVDRPVGQVFGLWGEYQSPLPAHIAGEALGTGGQRPAGKISGRSRALGLVDQLPGDSRWFATRIRRDPI